MGRRRRKPGKCDDCGSPDGIHTVLGRKKVTEKKTIIEHDLLCEVCYEIRTLLHDCGSSIDFIDRCRDERAILLAKLGDDFTRLHKNAVTALQELMTLAEGAS